MVEAIVYYSKCGHSLLYAKELSSKLNLPYYTLREAKKHLTKGSHILFMSWVKENKVMKLSSAERYKIECVCAVGILPKTEERVGVVIDKNQIYAPLYYLPGGIKKNRLGILQRISLKTIESELSFKLLDNGLKKEEALALDAILHNLNYVDYKMLNPIIEKYKKNEEYIS